MTLALDSKQREIVPENLVLKPQPQKILQRRRRQKKRGIINHLDDIPGRVPLGKLTPTLGGLHELHIMLAASDSVRNYFRSNFSPRAVAPVTETTPLEAGALALDVAACIWRICS
jgi:hypothetical protein